MISSTNLSTMRMELVEQRILMYCRAPKAFPHINKRGQGSGGQSFDALEGCCRRVCICIEDERPVGVGSTEFLGKSENIVVIRRRGIGRMA